MLLWWNAPFSYYIRSKQFLLDVAHGLGTLGPACAVLAPSLRAACARTRRDFQKRGGKQLQMWTLRRACAVLALRCGFA